MASLHQGILRVSLNSAETPQMGSPLFEASRARDAAAEHNVFRRRNIVELSHAPPKEWPKQTGVCCWWDTEPFSGQPVGVALCFRRSHVQYMTEGIFCSFACAHTYLIENKPEKLQLLKEMYCTLTRPDKESLSDLVMPRAPHFARLKKFGGDLSTEEFRAQSQGARRIFSRLIFPLRAAHIEHTATESPPRPSVSAAPPKRSISQHLRFSSLRRPQP